VIVALQFIARNLARDIPSRRERYDWFRNMMAVSKDR
jgi:hypothetical protein